MLFRLENHTFRDVPPKCMLFMYAIKDSRGKPSESLLFFHNEGFSESGPGDFQNSSVKRMETAFDRDLIGLIGAL